MITIYSCKDHPYEAGGDYYLITETDAVCGQCLRKKAYDLQIEAMKKSGVVEVQEMTFKAEVVNGE